MIPLDFPIIQRALIGSILAGLLTGLVGVFIIRMKLTSSSFCLSHAAFAGAALGITLSLNPLSMALIFSAIIASIIGPVADKAKLHADIIMSITFPLNMALAFIFITLAPSVSQLTGEFTTILWGSVLSMDINDIAILAIILLVTTIVFYLLWKEFFSIMFNKMMAEADGINTKFFVYLAIFIIGIVVTLSLKLVGGLLVFALLVNPASTAFQFLHELKKIVILSPLIGAATCAAGLILSLFLNWPVGACIVMISTLCFAISVFLSPKRKRG
ncbi:MAG: metal ABC transporter permease [Nitrososphaerales archaeon]